MLDKVRERFSPELERVAQESLGKPKNGTRWMEFQIDDDTHSLVVLFHYPSNDATGFEYLRRSVKMEFGSLTDQRPAGEHTIRPWVAEEFPELLADFDCQLPALELERSFWEKATILHAEYHRDAAKSVRDRFSRHYAGTAAVATRADISPVLSNNELDNMSRIGRVGSFRQAGRGTIWRNQGRSILCTRIYVPERAATVRVSSSSADPSGKKNQSMMWQQQLQ